VFAPFGIFFRRNSPIYRTIAGSPRLYLNGTEGNFEMTGQEPDGKKASAARRRADVLRWAAGRRKRPQRAQRPELTDAQRGWVSLLMWAVHSWELGDFAPWVETPVNGFSSALPFPFPTEAEVIAASEKSYAETRAVLAKYPQCVPPASMPPAPVNGFPSPDLSSAPASSAPSSLPATRSVHKGGRPRSKTVEDAYQMRRRGEKWNVIFRVHVPGFPGPRSFRKTEQLRNAVDQLKKRLRRKRPPHQPRVKSA
jgi:hypothetical protein